MRKSEANRRLIEAEKGRVQPNIDEIYEPGDKIIFLHKDDKWEGPGTVAASDGNTFHVTLNGNYRKVAKCRSRRWFSEEDEIEASISSEDENEVAETSPTDDCYVTTSEVIDNRTDKLSEELSESLGKIQNDESGKATNECKEADDSCATNLKIRPKRNSMIV